MEQYRSFEWPSNSRCFLNYFRAPEISLTPDGSNREELFCSTQSRVERQLSRTGPEEPLLSDSKRQPRYSVFEV